MGTDGEHGVRDAVVPLDALRARHVRAGIAVPWAAGELRRVAPGGVGDDMTVVAEQRFDDGEDGCVANGLLRPRPAVEHLVAVLVAAAAFGAGGGEHVVELGAQGGDLFVVEHAAQHGEAVALEFDAGVGDLVGEHSEVPADPSDHVRILPGSTPHQRAEGTSAVCDAVSVERSTGNASQT